MKHIKDNVGKCGHAKCAGGNGCYEKGKPMRTYAPITLVDLTDRTTDLLRQELAQLSRHIDEDGAVSHHDIALEEILTREITRREKEGETVRTISCPLCGANAEHREHLGTHAYVCEECPFIGFEYYRDGDYQNLKNIIK